MDHRKRFERWRQKIPPRTKQLVTGVLTRIVPAIEAQGFGWYSNYAGGDPQEVASGTIPLQRREGPEWPTVELWFANRGRPWFNLYFAALPPICRRLGEPIPRELANVLYAPAYFKLCKGERRDYVDVEFGYHWFSLRPSRLVDAEIAKALRLLDVVFELFDRGIPEGWSLGERRYVSPNVRLGGSWKLSGPNRAQAADNSKILSGSTD